MLNRLGRHEQAYYSALKATHLEPRDAAAFFQQAHALTHLERTTQALDALARHEELAGESSGTRYLRARIAFAGKRYVECLRFCGQIEPDDPEYADAMPLEFQAGLESDAFDSIDAVLACMPGAAFSQTALALIKKRESQGRQNNPRLLALAAEVGRAGGGFRGGACLLPALVRRGCSVWDSWMPDRPGCRPPR